MTLDDKRPKITAIRELLDFAERAYSPPASTGAAPPAPVSEEAKAVAAAVAAGDLAHIEHDGDQWIAKVGDVVTTMLAPPAT